MANLNGVEVDFSKLSLDQIGDRILKSSQFGNCQDISLILTNEEEDRFKRISLLVADRFLEKMILDAIERKIGLRPTGINCVYSFNDRTFRTFKT